MGRFNVDKDKMNKLIDGFDPKMIDKAINAIADMSDLEFARSQSKHDDKAAREHGIERLTVFVKGEYSMLLIKPIKGMCEQWQLNLRNMGVITFDNPKFDLQDVAGEFFRFGITANGFRYWTDLIDEKQAQDVATFLEIGIGTQC
ncbi:conserved hypothetical protein [Vibrio chagasii]|nr:conserved hypothetical protein [Vibrio chagasii]